MTNRVYSVHNKKFKAGKLSNVMSLVYQINETDTETVVLFTAVVWKRDEPETESINNPNEPQKRVVNWNKRNATKWAVARLATSPIQMNFLSTDGPIGYYQYRRLEAVLFTHIYENGLKLREVNGSEDVFDMELTEQEWARELEFRKELKRLRNTCDFEMAITGAVREAWNGIAKYWSPAVSGMHSDTSVSE